MKTHRYRPASSPQAALKAGVLALLVAGAAPASFAYMETESLFGFSNDSPAAAESILASAFALDGSTTLATGAAPYTSWLTAVVEGSVHWGQVSGDTIAFDVDFFSFAVPQGGRKVVLDVDGASRTLSTGPGDTTLGLFDSSHTLIAYSDNDGTDTGSTTIPIAVDPAIGVLDLAEGTYFVALSSRESLEGAFPNALPGTGTSNLMPYGELVIGATPGDASYSNIAMPDSVTDVTEYSLIIGMEQGMEPIPIPASLPLLGSALAGLVFVARRRGRERRA